MEDTIKFLNQINNNQEFKDLFELDEYLKAYLIFIEWQQSDQNGINLYEIAIENNDNLKIKINENDLIIYYQNNDDEWIQA